MEGSATFSEETPPRFRWRLDRWWTAGPRALICMANPSKAGAEDNDPTIVQCNKLIEALGHPGYSAVNSEPFIATSPKELNAWKHNRHFEAAALEGENLALIRSLSITASVRFVAWGNLVARDSHANRILDALSLDGKHPLYAFALTKDGRPRHPMARGKNRITPGTEPVLWQKVKFKRLTNPHMRDCLKRYDMGPCDCGVEP